MDYSIVTDNRNCNLDSWVVCLEYYCLVLTDIWCFMKAFYLNWITFWMHGTTCLTINYHIQWYLIMWWMILLTTCKRCNEYMVSKLWISGFWSAQLLQFILLQPLHAIDISLVVHISVLHQTYQPRTFTNVWYQNHSCTLPHEWGTDWWIWK